MTATEGTASRRPGLPIASPKQARKELWRLARPHRGLLGGATGALLLRSVAFLVPPAVVGWIVDDVVEGADAGDLVAPLVLLGVGALVAAVLTGVGTSLVSRLGENVLASLREEVVDRSLHTSQDHLERAGTGDLLARVSNDVQVVSEATRVAFPAFVATAFTIGVTFVGIFALDWRLALAGAAAVPVQVLSLRWHIRRSRPIYAEERAVDSERAQELYDAIGGVATVRAMGLGARHRSRVDDRSQEVNRLNLASAVQKLSFFARLNGAEVTGLASILIVGFFSVQAGHVSVGAVTAAALYFEQLFDPIMLLLSLSDEAQRSTAALERLVGVLHLPKTTGPTETWRRAVDNPPSRLSVSQAGEIETSEGGLSAGGLHRTAGAVGVVLRGVSFSYGGGPVAAGPLVVQDVDLTIAPGEHVALVGTSGAGKSTLAKLVAGVHEPTAGVLSVGGLPVHDLGEAGTRRLVALVTQEAHVFAGPLADDLRLVAPDATDDQLLEALATVEADGWVRALPEGLATEVGAGARSLSTTQGLQVALARLLLLDPPVAVLDEATADAGSASARALERAAERAVAGRTALVVAHRLSQAAAADRILVMDEGRVVEAGPHDVLAGGSGPYARLWSAWTASRPDG
jgi:ATP-binding cassette subfamily C protein